MRKEIMKAVTPWALAMALVCCGALAAAQTSASPGSSSASPSSPATSPQANPGSASSGAASTQAQGTAPSPSQVDETIAWLTQSVNLTSDQQQKLRPILQGEVTQMTAVSQDNTLSPEQKQQKMVDIRRAAGPQIQAILTPQQQQKIQQMHSAQSGSSSPQR